MKKKILVLSVAISLILATSAYSQFLLNDRFDSFNSDLWNDYSRLGGSASVENGYLKLTAQEGTPVSAGVVSSKFNISGNYDIQVDFSLAVFNAGFSDAGFVLNAMDGSYQMVMYRSWEVNNSQPYISYWRLDGGVQNVGVIPTSDQSGKFRFLREGNQIGSYFWGESGWIPIITDYLPGGISSPVTVDMIASNGGDYGSSPYVEDNYDNFYVHASRISGVDESYIIAQPEPGTIILLGSGLLGLGAFNYVRRRK
ncbi:MAG: PEP-CTERM sorting domain-containing protein [Candidatus Zixiibacteriota bacterium]